jgi:glycosyltransferase involved in cell wall biosynthesis
VTEPQAPKPGKSAAQSIVHVVDSLEVGGLERTVVRLAIAQKKAGDDVQIITIWSNGPLAAPLTEAGIPVTCMAKRHGLDIRTIKRLRDTVSTGVDVIHTHNVMPHYYATAASLGLKVRRVSTRHDMGMHLKGKRMNFLYNLSLYKTHAVVAVCEAARSRFVAEKIVPQNIISVIYNGIPAINKNGSENRKTKEARRKLSLPLEGPIVGSIGRLNVVKDYGTLIRAFEEVLKAYPAAKLVIAGNGPEKNDLQRLIDSLEIQENVVLLGERNDAEELLAQFDVFALTSLTEGFSVALVEAAWSGLPIVATDVGGNKEIVKDNETGFLAEPKNIQDIKTKIEALLANENLRLTFGNTGRKHAEKHWTLELMRDRYKTTYQCNEASQ